MSTDSNSYETTILVLKQALEQLDKSLGLQHTLRGGVSLAGSNSDQTLEAAASESLFDRISEEDLFNQLVQLIGGDRNISNQLIAREQNKYPGEARKESIARVLARLLKNRRQR
ncbi:MAG: hypothetical protein AB1846_05855 [Chloroflexota bacterium]